MKPLTYRPCPTPRHESGLSPFGKGGLRGNCLPPATKERGEELESLFDWVVEWNNAMAAGRTGEDGRGSNGQKPDLSNAKKLSPEEQEKLASRRKKSKLLDDTMSAFDKIAKDEGKSLKYYKIKGTTGMQFKIYRRKK